MARSSTVALEPREIGSHDWYVYTIDMIRQRFFHAEGFFIAGPRLLSGVWISTPQPSKRTSKNSPTPTWLPEMADRLRRSSRTSILRVNIETVVKTFTSKSHKARRNNERSENMLTGVAVGASMLSVFEIIASNGR